MYGVMNLALLRTALSIRQNISFSAHLKPVYKDFLQNAVFLHSKSNDKISSGLPSN